MGYGIHKRWSFQERAVRFVLTRHATSPRKAGRFRPLFKRRLAIEEITHPTILKARHDSITPSCLPTAGGWNVLDRQGHRRKQ